MNTRLIHAICHYYVQWIPGDERGWRSRDHRVHCSGDYRDPPPENEHDGLRRHVRKYSNTPMILNPAEYPTLGSAFLYRLHTTGSSVRCLACGLTHVHLLYDSIAPDARKELGRAKQYASLKLPSRPGRLWARGAKIIVVKSLGHARRSWRYVLDHGEKEGAWTWRYGRDAVPEKS